MSHWRNSILARVTALVIATLVAGSGAFAAVADWDTQREPAAVHFEAQGTNHDTGAHPEDCSFCRHLVSAFYSGAGPAAGGGEPPVFSDAVGAGARPAQRTLAAIERPRPPPGTAYQL